MSYNNYNRGYAEPTMTSADYMTRTYRWMALGLLITFAAAFVTATTPLFYVVNSLYLLFTIAELALVIVGALAATVLALGNRHQRVTYDFGTDAPFVEGVDISEHNGTVDWTTLAKSAKFAFIRVGYRGYNDGALHADKMAKENLKAARKAGVPVGVYFFSQATTEEEAQEEARFVLEAVRFAKVELPLIIDYEYGYNAAGEHAGRLYDANVSKKDTTRLLTAFCDTVTDDGYTAGVFANSRFYISKFDAASLPKGTLRWVADYNSAVTYTGNFDIWQYSKTGKIKGNGRIFSITGLHLIGKHLPQLVLFDESQQVLADVTGNKRLSGVQGISW